MEAGVLVLIPAVARHRGLVALVLHVSQIGETDVDI